MLSVTDAGAPRTDCSIYSEDCTASVGFTCNECPDSTGGAALAVVISLFTMMAFAAFLSYTVSGERNKVRIAARVARQIALQSLKIVVAAWQFCRQVRVE